MLGPASRATRSTFFRPESSRLNDRHSSFKRSRESACNTSFDAGLSGTGQSVDELRLDPAVGDLQLVEVETGPQLATGQLGKDGALRRHRAWQLQYGLYDTMAFINLRYQSAVGWSEDEPHGRRGVPMNMILFRIGWMECYEGLDDEGIHGGGRFVDKHKWGGEVFNFRHFNGKVYGFVHQRKGNTININRLGATDADDYVASVLVIWVARKPGSKGGSYIVGWYTNATVYREWQDAPPGSERHVPDRENISYNITALAADAILLPPEERSFPVPQQRRGQYGMGKINIRYADGDGDDVRLFRQQVLKYIAEYTTNRSLPVSTDVESSIPRQPDPSRRQEVERIAVKRVRAHYEEKNYRVDSVERDNVGWDLEAVRGCRKLRIEVKGLSGSQTKFELTPNEYRKMQKHRSTYRICVVTNALADPKLAIFRFRDNNRWEDKDGHVLEIKKATAARCEAG